MLDAPNNRLLTINERGQVLKLIPLDKAQLRLPEGLSFGANGQMYIGSEGGKRGERVLVMYQQGIYNLSKNAKASEDAF